jgi:hypothetical protein
LVLKTELQCEKSDICLYSCGEIQRESESLLISFSAVMLSVLKSFAVVSNFLFGHLELEVVLEMLV